MTSQFKAKIVDGYISPFVLINDLTPEDRPEDNKDNELCIDSEETIRNKISSLEEALKNEQQFDFPLKHTFAPGVYCREIFIPAGSVIVGKIHRHAHLNFISKGDVTVLTKDGLKRIKGPCTMVSTAGTKRALYAHEDTIWTTIHANPNDTQDLEEIESFVIAKDYISLEKETLNIIGHLGVNL